MTRQNPNNAAPVASSPLLLSTPDSTDSTLNDVAPGKDSTWGDIRQPLVVRRNSLPLSAQVAIVPFFGEVTKIQGLARRAVVNGRITEPSRCELCNKPQERWGYRVNGHHESYFAPFDLIFLCGRCHSQRHLRLREQNRDPRVVYALERLDGRPCPVPYAAPHPEALASVRARVRAMETAQPGVE